MMLVSHYGDRLHVPALACKGDGPFRPSAVTARKWQHTHLGCANVLFHEVTGFTVTVTLGSFDGGTHGLVTLVAGGDTDVAARWFTLLPRLDADYVGCVNSAIQGLLTEQLCNKGQWRLHYAAA